MTTYTQNDKIRVSFSRKTRAQSSISLTDIMFKKMSKIFCITTDFEASFKIFRMSIRYVSNLFSSEKAIPNSKEVSFYLIENTQ